MMVLLLRYGEDRYAVDVKDVVEVIPCVPLQVITRAPAYVCGLLNYRGSVTPVLDLSLLISEHATAASLSSRIIMVTFNKCYTVGLMAEHVTEALKVDSSIFTPVGIAAQTEAFVDYVAVDENGMIQKLNIAKVLPADVMELLEQCAVERPGGSGYV